jgi:hypothetical protein
MTKLERSDRPMTVGTLVEDEITLQVMKVFDIAPEDLSERISFYPWVVEDVLPPDWGLGLIVGASGTGKTTMLGDIGGYRPPVRWERDLPVAAHFRDFEDAMDRLGAVGLNSVPTWAKPYHVLSTGERFRADLARALTDDARIDEYTSTVSRTVAQAASRSLGGWMKRNNARRIVLATCHFDVIDWLEPDWVIDTDHGTFTDDLSVKPERWWLEFVREQDGAVRCE